MAKPQRFPSVPEGDLQRIRDIWSRLYHEIGEPPGGMAELWFMTFATFHAEKGNLVYSRELLKAEERLIEMGLAKELYSALSNVVSPDLSKAEDEFARIYELVRATPEERKQAIWELRCEE